MLWPCNEKKKKMKCGGQLDRFVERKMEEYNDINTSPTPVNKAFNDAL